MSTLLALALPGIVSVAFAAELPSICGANADELCVDADGDGWFANATLDEAKDCADDLEANWYASKIFPGAPVALTDGADTNCDGTDDDAEMEEALEAAGGDDSPKGQRLLATIALCTGDTHEADPGFVWTSARGGDCDFPVGYEGWDFDRASGVIPRAVVVEASRRRAGDAVVVTALGTALGTKGVPAVAAVPAVPATDTTPEIPAVAAIPAIPATGMYAELAAVEAEATKANGELRKELTDKATALKKSVGEAEAAIFLLQLRGKEDRASIADLYASAPIFEIGVSGLLYGGRSLYEYVGGPLVRSGLGGGIAAVVTTGYGWDGHQLYLDLAFSQGGEESGMTELPLSLGFAAVGHQWVIGDIVVGPEALIFASSMGNPIDPTVSAWGIGAGMKAGYFLDTEDSRTRIGLVTRIDVVADSFGTNDAFDKGVGVIGTVGLTVGRGPER